ncbi:molybdate ABC transporter substrate-binding protein [Caldanaerobius polysaccharolyticus]|uniref:molybdate ABC transporter substrate-binding protein n=1 Tax=Caldanaerobius polysaccharolyticus TaxID=44256 RepID=UPI000553599D|nr:molybdate ABC transporter substrate-binding protein [Caldanaerobius polysaccharolyticus]
MDIKRIGLICLMAFLIVFGGCSVKSIESSDNSKEQPSTENKVLRVAAAADLSMAFKEIGERFEEKNGCKVQLIIGSSGTLAQQIESGAPFDVFASADLKYIDQLDDKGKMVHGTKKLYAQGRIALATKIEGSLRVEKLDDLTNQEVKKIAIANPEHAPYGAAAQQALEKAGVWDKVKDKLVYGKNVEDTLSLVETGNADAGIVAVSIASKRVKLYPIDESLYTPLKQYIGVIKRAKEEDLAKRFVGYVVSGEGKSILKKYGFAFGEE